MATKGRIRDARGRRVTQLEFSIQLSAYYPDKDYGGDRLYRDMLEQAAAAKI